MSLITGISLMKYCPKSFSDGAEQPNGKTESDSIDLSKKLKDMPNAMFYLNLMQSRPQGDFIDKIHKYWYLNKRFRNGKTKLF